MTNPTQLIEQLVNALADLIEEKCDYMRRNHLGDPEREHATKYGRAALTAARSHLEQPTKPAPISQFGSEEMQALILAKLAAPSTAGSGEQAYASPAYPKMIAPSTAGEREEVIAGLLDAVKFGGTKSLFQRAAAILQSTALPVGELTDEQLEQEFCELVGLKTGINSAAVDTKRALVWFKKGYRHGITQGGKV